MCTGAETKLAMSSTLLTAFRGRILRGNAHDAISENLARMSAASPGQVSDGITARGGGHETDMETNHGERRAATFWSSG
jgi:hypothetical protein